MLVAVTFWAIIYGIEVATVTPKIKIFWGQLKYIGITITPVAWFVFALAYTKRDNWLQPKNILALSIIPIITILIALTNDLHNLMWQGVIDSSGPFSIILVEFRYWFWIHTAYSYLLVVASFILIALQFRRADATTKKQVTVLLAAGLFPFLGNVLFVLSGDMLNNFDITPIMFVLTGFFLTIGLFPLNLLESPANEQKPVSYSLDTEIGDIVLGSRQQILSLLLIGSLVACLSTLTSGVLQQLGNSTRNWSQFAWMLLPTITFLAILIIRKISHTTRTIIFLVAWYILSVISLYFFGLDLDTGVSFLVFVMFTFFLLGLPPSLGALSLTAITMAIGGFFIANSQLVPSSRLTTHGSIDLLFVGLNFLMLSAMIIVAQLNLQRFVTNLFKEAQDLSFELENERQLLEQRVAERTRDLETSFAITRQISKFSTKQELFSAVVNLLQERFGFYHVYIYLYDQARQQLQFVEGTGDAGIQLKQEQFTIPANVGLVGQVASTGQNICINNVYSEPNWIGHELLPHTQSEAITPIVAGKTILGVLGIQSDEVAGINQGQLSLFEAITSQMAVMLQKIDTLNIVQEQNETETILSQTIQQIRQTTAIDRAAQVAIREVGRVLQKPTNITLTSLEEALDSSS